LAGRGGRGQLAQAIEQGLRLSWLQQQGEAASGRKPQQASPPPVAAKSVM
jgi:hypothetical protein